MNARGGLKALPLHPRSGGLEGEERVTPSNSAFGLDDFIAVLRKRVWLLVGCVGLALTLAVFSLAAYSPQYVASAQMLLGTQGGNDRNSSDLLEDRALTDSAIQGELAILGSSALLIRVVQRLELDQDPEFNSALRPPPDPVPVIDPIRNAIGAVLEALRGLTSPSVEADPDADAAPSEGIAEASSARDSMLGEYADTVNALRGRLSMRQRGNSFVVEVTAVSEDPAKAAAIANTVVDEYIDFVSDRRFEAAQRFTTWLETRVGELADVVEESETAVISFEALADSEIDNPERLEQQMQEMTTRFVDTSARLAETEARAAKARELLDGEGLVAAATILDSEALSRYTSEVAALRRDEALARDRYSEDSPQLAAIRREATVLQEDLRAEVDRAVLELENQAGVLRVNLQAIRQSLKSLENTVLARSKDQIKLNQLERIADANRRIYEDFLGRFKESSEIQNLRRADAEVITYGSPPESPSLPRKKVTIILSIAAGLFVGIGVAFLLELLPKRFVTSDQITRLTGLSVLGHLPNLPRQCSARALAARLQGTVAGPMARAALTTVRNFDLTLGRPARSVQLAAKEDTGDKSTLAMLLGWAAARRGKSCLLLDADVKSAGLTERFEVSPAAGFVEVLYGDASLDDVIIHDEGLGVSLLPMVPAMIDPATLFGTERADQLFKVLSERFDLVIIDAPELEDVSDLVSLPSPIDMGLLVLRSNLSPIKPSIGALPLFQSMNVLMPGAILTRLKPRT